ncbi:MAG: aminotransferase class I/II-fold pyridoxal phosphate-dependent enzyme [Lachnospira sp.]|nr:aminotransferase class I/II-fold pyridoxal phosphate-dependent enzyme [Lachnospira sp.]
MEFNFSDKANRFKPNIFNILNERKADMQARGKRVYDLFVGTPDFKPEKHVMDVVVEASKDPENYKYSLGDTKELIDSVKKWYARRYDVNLESNEIMSVAGSQEGFAHVAMTVCNPGDLVLVPNPGYPVFEMGPYLNDAEIDYYELDKDNHFMPALDRISEEKAKKAKMMIVSYPLNPTCTCADRDFYVKLMEFAKKYNILIVHDNAYSEIIYDGREGISFLSVPGAKEVGIEFNSLSKTYNLTGLRISFAVGNAEVIKKFKTIRSQFDYGTSYIVQKAAIAALDGPQEGVKKQCLEYQKRRDALCGGLNSIGWEVPYSEGTMFVWAPVPKGFETSDDFCMQMLENTGVLCTPGSAFGNLGEGYVRFALVLPVETIKEAVELIGQWLKKYYN